MFGFQFIKADPTTYLMQVRRGNVVREGTGQSFFYYARTSTLVAVPVGSQSLPFIFELTTADFQSVTVQGNLSYRVSEPRKTGSMLNFALKSDGKAYASDEPQQLRARVEGVVEVLVQQAVNRRPLREALRAAEAIAAEVEGTLGSHPVITALGLAVASFSVAAVKPRAETARALEAEVREQILKASDDAIYTRRNAAVENERSIKESELDTEIAVEMKQRSIREAKMAADAAIAGKEAELAAARMESGITLEGRRRELVGLEASNTRTVSEAEAHRVAAVMHALAGADPKIVQALAAAGMNPGQLIAQAFGGIADRAERIGELNVSPELLHSLIGGKR